MPSPFEFRLYWQQEPDEIEGAPPVWEFEFSADGNNWAPVEVGSVALECATCWEVSAFAPEPGGYVRARARWDSGLASDWSAVTRAPEPAFPSLLLAGVVLLAVLARRVRPSNARAPARRF